MELPSPFAGKGNLRRQMSFIQLFFSEQVRRNVQLSSRRHCAAAAATSSIVELVGSRRYGGGGGGGRTADNTARRLIVKSMLVHRPFFLPLCKKKHKRTRIYIPY